MNREQKQALAGWLIQEVGEMFEFWEERMDDYPQGHILREINVKEAAQTVANWLGKLPGESWTSLLPEPNYNTRK